MVVVTEGQDELFTLTGGLSDGLADVTKRVQAAQTGVNVNRERISAVHATSSEDTKKQVSLVEMQLKEQLQQIQDKLLEAQKAAEKADAHNKQEVSHILELILSLTACTDQSDGCECT